MKRQNSGRWQLLGGPTRKELRPVSSARRIRFETALVAPHMPWIMVRALDKAGRTLEYSRLLPGA